MSDESADDAEIDAFLDSEDSVEDLLKAEYAPKHEGMSDEFYQELHPQQDTRDDELEVSASPDERLIRGKGIAFTDVDTEGVTLDEELTPEEEVAATHGPGDEFSDPALNSVYKATMSERATRERALMDKRELLDLAGDIVDDYFRKHVKTNGVDDSRLNELKFAARRVIARKLSEGDDKEKFYAEDEYDDPYTDVEDTSEGEARDHGQEEDHRIEDE